MSIKERLEQLSKVADVLRKNKEEYAKIMTDEMGKTLKQSKQEIDLCAAICQYTAQTGPKALQTEERDGE